MGAVPSAVLLGGALFYGANRASRSISRAGESVDNGAREAANAVREAANAVDNAQQNIGQRLWRMTEALLWATDVFGAATIKGDECV